MDRAEVINLMYELMLIGLPSAVVGMDR